MKRFIVVLMNSHFICAFHKSSRRSEGQKLVRVQHQGVEKPYLNRIPLKFLIKTNGIWCIFYAYTKWHKTLGSTIKTSLFKREILYLLSFFQKTFNEYWIGKSISRHIGLIHVGLLKLHLEVDCSPLGKTPSNCVIHNDFTMTYTLYKGYWHSENKCLDCYVM